jgi:hypothetical protein
MSALRKIGREQARANRVRQGDVGLAASADDVMLLSPC